MAERVRCGVSREDFLKMAGEGFDRFEATGLEMVVLLNERVSLCIATGETMLALMESAADDLEITVTDTVQIEGQGRVN